MKVASKEHIASKFLLMAKGFCYQQGQPYLTLEFFSFLTAPIHEEFYWFHCLFYFFEHRIERE